MWKKRRKKELGTDMPPQEEELDELYSAGVKKGMGTVLVACGMEEKDNGKQANYEKKEKENWKTCSSSVPEEGVLLAQ